MVLSLYVYFRAYSEYIRLDYEKKFTVLYRITKFCQVSEVFNYIKSEGF
jgi:hypothetical protein